jgi:ribonuclease R
LDKYLNGGRSVNVDKLEEQCKHSSDMEQLAANAERASIKYKQVEYMADRLGEVYSGVISGVTEWGLYVELDENKCEGLVPVRDLADDYYDFDEKNYSLVGRRRGNKYRLGDAVKVRVARANLDRKQLDFVLADDKIKSSKQITGEDVTVAQALSGAGKKSKKSAAKSAKASKSSKNAKASKKASKASKAKTAKKAKGAKTRKK